VGFVLIIFGVAFILAGYHGNAKALFSQIGGEFSGSPSFGKWLLAILVIGGIGYISPLKKVSDAFLVLVLLVLFLSNKGFFSQFSAQFGLGGNGGGLLGANNSPTVNPTNNPFQTAF